MVDKRELVYKGESMKKLLYVMLVLVMAFASLMGCNETPEDGSSANAPKVTIQLPEGVSDVAAENEIRVSLKESFTDNGLTSSFVIASGDAVLVSVNGGNADFALEWNGDRDAVLKVKLADGEADCGKFQIVVTTSWVESKGISKDSFTHSFKKDIFYATENGKIAYSLESESDALEKLK